MALLRIRKERRDWNFPEHAQHLGTKMAISAKIRTQWTMFKMQIVCMVSRLSGVNHSLPPTQSSELLLDRLHACKSF